MGVSIGVIITGDGCRIAYRFDGSAHAPLLIFSNSLGCDMHMWDEQVNALSDQFHILRYDSRGHGLSDAPPGAYSMDRLGRDVVELMDALKIKSAHFCGLSMGGMVGQWLGARAPSRVQHLVLANMSAYMGPPSSWEERIELIREDGMAAIVDAVLGRWFTTEFIDAEPALISEWRTALRRVRPEGYAGCCAAIRDMDLRLTNHLIEAPTMIIVGDQDIATPAAHGEQVLRDVKQATIEYLDAAHLSNIERSEEFTDVIRMFLSGSRS